MSQLAAFEGTVVNRALENPLRNGPDYSARGIATRACTGPSSPGVPVACKRATPQRHRGPCSRDVPRGRRHPLRRHSAFPGTGLEHREAVGSGPSLRVATPSRTAPSRRGRGAWEPAAHRVRWRSPRGRPRPEACGA
jgi:hypothetical protein